MKARRLFARATFDDRWQVVELPAEPPFGPRVIAEAGMFDTEEAAQAWIAGYLVADEEWREFGVLGDDEFEGGV